MTTNDKLRQRIYQARYKKTEKGKATERRYKTSSVHFKRYRLKYKYQWNKKYPERLKAQQIVKKLIEKGELVRQPCINCGKTEFVHAHHSDYSKPRKVTWLCPLHHAERHKLMKGIYNVD